MDFERARTKEQKNKRISEILEASMKQYLEIPYDKITLASISKELSFSRVNLYKYFNSKEEIFLKIIELDIYKWVDKLMLIFKGQPAKDIDSFAKKWAASIYSQKRLLGLMSKQFTDLEKNSSVEKLIDFKKSYFPLMQNILDILCEQLPMLDKNQTDTFMKTNLIYAIGLFSVCDMSDNQKKVLEIMEIDFKKPDFVKTLTEFTLTYINGVTV